MKSTDKSNGSPLARPQANVIAPPSLRVSISSSPVRQGPTVIASPTSPARSISGALMGDLLASPSQKTEPLLRQEQRHSLQYKHEFEMPLQALHSSSPSHKNGITQSKSHDTSPEQVVPWHNYSFNLPELLPEEQSPSEYGGAGLDFFDDTDAEPSDQNGAPSSDFTPGNEHDSNALLPGGGVELSSPVHHQKLSTPAEPMDQNSGVSDLEQIMMMTPVSRSKALYAAQAHGGVANPGFRNGFNPDDDYFLFDESIASPPSAIAQPHTSAISQSSAECSPTRLSTSHSQQTPRSNPYLWAPYPDVQSSSQLSLQFRQSGQPAPSSSYPTNILKLHALSVQALRNEPLPTQRQNSARESQRLDQSFNSFMKQINPIYPEPTLRSTSKNSTPQLKDGAAPSSSSVSCNKQYQSVSSPAAPPSAMKKVSLAPPALSISPGHHFTPPAVYTPYPRSSGTTIKSSPLASSEFRNLSDLNNELLSCANHAHLALSVRRRYAPHARRVSLLHIPRAAIAAFVPGTKGGNSNENRNTKGSEKSERNSKEKKKKKVTTHRTGPEFDDPALFRELRRKYHNELLGSSWPARWWRRWCSARVLHRIAIVTAVDEANHAPHSLLSLALQSPASFPSPSAPRIPATSAYSDVVETEDMTEERLWQYFQNPRRGEDRNSWTRWAQQRVTGRAAASMNEQPRLELPGGQEDPCALLEFLEGWSVWRVLAALTAVLLASVAILLLWLFLAPNGGLTGAKLGHNGRIGTSFVMAVLVLLLGWTGVGGWMWVSWLVM